MRENQDKLKNKFSPSEIAMCRSKKKHGSREAATFELLRKKQFGLIEPSRFLRAYKCPHCQGWHNTHDDERNLLPFKEQMELNDRMMNVDLKEVEKIVNKIESKTKKKKRH
tara:strand:+ start:274 stop:606 length:333 start_codon:yes stop_codon:yes gene_type:complete